ncbi:hypothetical protein GCM10009841_11070 [Microlunatus panaciterrae]|uniref:Uncharacterized protein n=1 Tax=Microlunatus panaciterrae TaxID=400768 RepID=A0ABS2RKX2_9ACTN|nr:DUF6350 family protein [Microlunatus panaciterrae]MBM7799664.1 hypothetical protein [Microlunatus panaciterrae]
MASLLSPRRGSSDIHLTATVPLQEVLQPRPEEPVEPPFGWALVSVVGGLSAAAFGWVLVAGLAVVGWLAADTGSLPSALAVGTQLWLLANGGGAHLGGLRPTLVPLGVTAVFAVMLSRFAAVAGRQASGDQVRPIRAWSRIVAIMTSVYTVAVGVVALLAGGPGQAGRAAVGALLISAIASAWGSHRALELRPAELLPAWGRSVPVAVAGAMLTMVLAGSAALVAALVANFSRVEQLGTVLQTGVAGGIALLALQLAFAPNAVLWAASYALGAGFSVGDGSLVSPTSTDLGVLPGLPILGALPAEGPGDDRYFWWLAAGVLAGAVAALLVMRGRPSARFDETSLVGGLAGALSGLAFVALAWAAGGDLGSGRLSDLGPRLGPLLVMAVTLMGLSGMVAGLLLGLVRRRRSPR